MASHPKLKSMPSRLSSLRHIGSINFSGSIEPTIHIMPKLRMRARKRCFHSSLPFHASIHEFKTIDTIASKPPLLQNSFNRSVISSNLINIPLTKKALSTQTSDSLIVATFNAQSLGPTCQEKRIAIYDFIIEKSIDIFLIQESWFKVKGDEAKCKEMTPPGFTCKSYPRSNRGGGLAIIFKDTLLKHLAIKTDFSFAHKSFECALVLLNFPSKSIHLWNIYRTFPSKKNELKDEDFFSEFSNLLEQINTSTCVSVIFGDLNFHFNKPSLFSTRKINDMLDTFNLVQSVSEPTHSLGNTLDVVIHRDTDQILIDTEVNHNLSSDHYCVVAQLAINVPPTEATYREARNIKRIDRERLGEDLRMKISTIKCCNFEQFNDTLSSILDDHAPIVRKKVRTNKNDPWFDDIKEQVREAKRIRRHAEKKKDKTGLTIDKQIYITAKKNVTRIISKARTDYYSSEVKKCSNGRQFYRLISTLAGTQHISPLPTNHKIDDLPQIFSDYFSKKIADIRSDLDRLTDLGHTSLSSSTRSCSSSFSVFRPVSELEVRKIILQSKPTTCSIDSFPTPLLIEFLDPLLPTITHLMNNSLLSGSFPTSFKNAVVKPLLKKSNLDQNTLKNYRPVSNLSFLSKILEKLVLQQLFQYLDTHSLLSPNQSAYRPAHSTETALLKVTNDLLTALDKGDVSFLTLLDLSAAFDTIDHSLLFQILSHSYGITDIVLSWFKSYLHDRTQSVSINNCLSSSATLTFGVPQGSVLGPILFIMYTQPLHTLIQQHSIKDQSFADDTQIYKSCKPIESEKTLQTMQSCITQVKSWMTDHKLKLNDDKTEALLIHTPRSFTTLSKPSSILVCSSTIPFAPSARNLGFILSDDLTVDAHISHICRSAYAALRQISSIRQYLTLTATKTLVCSLVLSRLDYANSLLSNCPKHNITKLQKVQNAAARLTLKIKKRDHITQARKQLHWLPIEARIAYKLCLHCHYFFHGSSPVYLADLLSIYTPGRTLRSSSDHFTLKIPSIKTKKYGERAFSFAAPETWNSLPLSIRQQSSTPAFKRSLKTYLFQLHYP